LVKNLLLKRRPFFIDREKTGGAARRCDALTGRIKYTGSQTLNYSSGET
jgi:hypothetical protein